MNEHNTAKTTLNDFHLKFLSVHLVCVQPFLHHCHSLGHDNLINIYPDLIILILKHQIILLLF